VAGRYRVVLLDVGETLIGVVNPERAYQAALAALDLHVELEAVRQASDGAYAALAALGRRGPQPPHYAVDPAQEFAWRDRLVRELLARLGVRERLEQARQAIWDTWTAAVFQPFPETVRVLDRLRADGYTLGIVSNWDPRLEQVIRNHGLRDHFDFLVVSELEGYAKPSPRPFQRALEVAGVAAEQAIHVGDSFAADVVGARGVGIQPVWLDRSGLGPEPFAPTVTTLEELPEVLAGRLPLRGRVASANGTAGGARELERAWRALAEQIGFRPGPEALALRLERPADHAAWATLRQRPAALVQAPGARAVALWPARLADGGAAAVLAPPPADDPADRVEVLAPAPLRDALGLMDGDALTLYVGAADAEAGR